MDPTTSRVGDEVFFEDMAKLLEEGRTVRFRPNGNSMLPFMVGGRDSVTLEKKPSIEVGDICLFTPEPGRYVMHRVWSLSPDGREVEFMGDGNLSGTEKCPRDGVIATVTEILKPGGRIVKPGRARLWRRLLPVRRYILALYRRLPWIRPYTVLNRPAAKTGGGGSR